MGQLYRRWHNGELPINPHDFDVWEMDRTIGVSRDIEMVTEEPYGTAYQYRRSGPPRAPRSTLCRVWRPGGATARRVAGRGVPPSPPLALAGGAGCRAADSRPAGVALAGLPRV